MNKKEEIKEAQKETSMKTKLFWEIEVRDKNGKLIESRQVEARSWLRQFIVALKAFCACNIDAAAGEGNAAIVSESGLTRNIPRVGSGLSYGWGCNGALGNTNQGIVVGSGDTPNSITTYALASKIAHGTGSNQLVYGASSFEDVTNPSGNDLQFRITRTFTNNSGAVVTVKEIGLLARMQDTTATLTNFLFARDVLPSPVDVPDGATLTIRYVARITVS